MPSPRPRSGSAPPPEGWARPVGRAHPAVGRRGGTTARARPGHGRVAGTGHGDNGSVARPGPCPAPPAGAPRQGHARCRSRTAAVPPTPPVPGVRPARPSPGPPVHAVGRGRERSTREKRSASQGPATKRPAVSIATGEPANQANGRSAGSQREGVRPGGTPASPSCRSRASSRRPEGAGARASAPRGEHDRTLPPSRQADADRSAQHPIPAVRRTRPEFQREQHRAVGTEGELVRSLGRSGGSDAQAGFGEAAVHEVAAVPDVP